MKISFCTTCKNRLFHLEQTLPINLINSSSFENREFVILDYNSEDGLYEWAKKNLVFWERIGVVKYIRTKIPKNYYSAHAKNIAHKNASGDILCNLDSDNIIAHGFCEYLENLMTEPGVCVASGSQDAFGNHGCCGRISVKRDDFYRVNGYDESEEVSLGWGWDDVNFRLRVSRFNNLKIITNDVKYNFVINHDNFIRTKDFLNKNIVKSRDASMEAVKNIVLNSDYIANKNKNWGFIEDLKIGLE